MRHGTQGHVAEPRESTQAPAWRGSGADAWGGATRVHADARVALTWQCEGDGK